MTDESDRESDREFDREERAFRTALAARARAYEPVDRAVRTRPARRPPWGALGGIAAALVLVAGLVTLVLTADRNPSGTTASSGAAGAASAAATVPDPAAGMRWVSRYDVAVQVPSSWPYADPPARPDCIRTPADYHGPQGPYVAADTEFRGETAQGCIAPATQAPKAFGPLLFQLWQPYLAFARADAYGHGPDGTWTYRGWTLTRWTVSGVQLSLLTDPDQGGLAHRIRASARTFSVNENGCPATSPVQAKRFVKPPTIGGWFASSISVCQYDRTHGTSRPGLIGSRVVSDPTSLLDAIDKAPSGSGPNLPGSCTPEAFVGTAIELLGSPGNSTGPVRMYVYYDSCVGNGVVLPGGTTKELTRGICSVLFAKPEVAITEAITPVGERCMR